MTAFICETCGAQYAPVPEHPDAPPERCFICEDERQYVGHRGQRWTTNPVGLRESGRRNHVAIAEPGLTTIETRPAFGIGQRAHLIETPAGNFLWEPTSLIDDETVAAIRERGGLRAIASSHPHLYGSIIEFSHAFGGVPVWLPAADRDWIPWPDTVICYWDGDTADPLPGSGLRLIRVGGHFAGSAVLLWPAGAGGRGAAFCGDMPQVAADRRWVSFLYSYPNMIPLPASEVRRIAGVLAAYSFDRLYGSWAARVIPSDAHAAVQRSAARYVQFVSGEVGPIF
jgi:hypothetical protein